MSFVFNQELKTHLKKMNTVKVNSLNWQIKNLNKTTFNNGNQIPFAKDKNELTEFNDGKIPCYHWYKFDENNSYLGCCYNESAIKKICDITNDNFRIPTLFEWKDLLRITGYLFEQDESHLWDSTWDYNQNRQKENIKSLKDLKERGKWKSGNHSGNNRLGFYALPHDYGTFSSWAYIDVDNINVGTFCIGSTPTYKKIEAWHNANFTSNFVRLVRKVTKISNPGHVQIGEQLWSTENFNHLINGKIDIPLIVDSDKWGGQTRMQKPAYCYYNNDSEDGDILYNYFSCDFISKELPAGVRIASLSDFKNLFKAARSNDESNLLSLLDLSYWNQFYFLNYNKIKSSGLNVKPTGIRRASYVTHWEGEALYSYKYFSGKGCYTIFWTSDGYIVEVKIKAGKIIFETHIVDKYYNGLGLSIRLVKE